MWRECWHWLLRRFIGRTPAEAREMPPADPSTAPATPHAVSTASTEPWPFGHHVPPEVEENVERHRGEWRS